jgi:glycosyltransferase involved in cell wall biosynthesis
VVQPDDAVALAQALSAALDHHRDWAPLPETERAQLSWAAYGMRYLMELKKAHEQDILCTNSIGD